MTSTHAFRGALGMTLLVVGMLACGSASGATQTVPPGAPPDSLTSTPFAATSIPLPASVTATPASAPANPVFTVGVIVDLQSEPVRREQAEGIIAEASTFLHPLTSIGLLMTDFVEDGSGGSTGDMAARYINAHAGALPNGLVIFSYGDGGQARLLGGYSHAVAGPTGFRNAYSSPVMGNGQLYIAVVHFSHRYAQCGYGSSDTVQSTVSLDGECRNQPGTVCIQHNGYSMCSDSLPHLYASTATYFVASTIVHELMHPFSPGGDKDHYSTAECNNRMGYPPQFFDLQESQYHNGLCPFVYQEFVKAYQP